MLAIFNKNMAFYIKKCYYVTVLGVIIMDNKGFAVSAVLYTILIAFLMFLTVLLAMFYSSTSLISNANKDLIDGTALKISQVKPVRYFTETDEQGNEVKKELYCPGKQDNWDNKPQTIDDTYWDNNWNVSDNNIIVRINSRYGTFYWPRDFDGENIGINLDENKREMNCGSHYRFEVVTCSYDSNSGFYKFKIKDKNNDNIKSNEITLGNLCN